MWTADKWTDFEVLDCSGGEKLERWGKYTLVRPDPQVIWNTEKRHPAWNCPSARYERAVSGGGRWEKGKLPEKWKISYGELTFYVGPMNFKHTGIFPEQGANWDYIIQKVRNSAEPLRILNLFAYTGGATVAAAWAGASVCHVDGARGMVAWARENAKASAVENRPIRWIVDDCVKFVEREKRRGRRYDAIIMDPPSYGRGPSGEIWKLEDNLFSFVALCGEILSEKPSFVIINSYTTGLSPSVLTYLSESIFTKRFGGHSESRELGLSVAESGLILPCGATCRWEL